MTLEQLLLMYTSVVLPAVGCICCICRYQLTERSAYGDDLVIQLNGCSHAIHLDCLRAMVESTNQVSHTPSGGSRAMDCLRAMESANQVRHTPSGGRIQHLVTNFKDEYGYGGRKVAM